MARYRRVSPKPRATPESHEPKVDPATMTKDQLVAYAASLGVNTRGTKAEILERVQR